MQQYDNTADIINVILMVLFVFKSLLIITQLKARKDCTILRSKSTVTVLLLLSPYVGCAHRREYHHGAQAIFCRHFSTVVSDSDDSSVFEIYTPTTLIIVTSASSRGPYVDSQHQSLAPPQLIANIPTQYSTK